MAQIDYNRTSSVVVQGGVSATALAFFSDSAVKMIPYLIACIPLIILDLIWGVRAARQRFTKYGSVNDRPRFSKGLRKTFGKVCEYVCWCILASSLSLAFQKAWIEWVVLGIVFVNELSSIASNYLETKDLQISWKHVIKLLFKIGGDKIGSDLSDIDPSQFVKPTERREDAK